MAQEFNSFTAPFTASGRAALVPPPPWHYACWMINVALQINRDHSAALVPPALGQLTGQGCIHFADWQATTDGHELLDPVYAQYRETIVIVEIERPQGERFNYCPFIWVDQDLSLIRGLLQGWPKKLGSTYMTRSYPIDHQAAAPLRAGTALGASLCVKDRRLIEARLNLTGQPGQPYGLLTRPTIGTVAWPDLTQPQHQPQLRWVLPDIQDPIQSDWQAATATIQILSHPVEELSLLTEVEVQAASVGWVGLTVVGARPL